MLNHFHLGFLLVFLRRYLINSSTYLMDVNIKDFYLHISFKLNSKFSYVLGYGYL